MAGKHADLILRWTAKRRVALMLSIAKGELPVEKSVASPVSPRMYLKS